MGTNKPKRSNRIREQREARGWTQEDLMSEVGALTIPTVSRWETGITFPSPHYRKKLCEVFNMKFDELFPELPPDPPLQLIHDNAKTSDDSPGFDQTMEKVVQTLRSAPQAKQTEQRETRESNEQGSSVVQIELEVRQLELKRQQLQFEKEKRESEREDERKELEHVRHLAEELIEFIGMLEPDADPATKAQYLRIWLPQWLGKDNKEIEQIALIRLRRERR